MKMLQSEMVGEAEKAGIRTDNEVIELVKAVCSEIELL